MTGSLTIRRARLRNTELDAVTARLRLEPQLGTAELRPRGLPPAALLCVRRLVDPLPGRLELDSMQARPPPEWEQAFVDALTHLLQTAARPAREAVPANAEAVLFADRAELLACLARDARDGVAWTRWWWRSLSSAAAPGTDPVVEAWLAAPEHVPGALALLAARGEATAFVGALPLATAGQLARRVAAVFGAAQLERAIGLLALLPTGAAARSERPAREVQDTQAATVEQPPWVPTAPEARTHPLAPARELLLGVALALRRTPAVARSSAFATATATWIERGAPGPIPAGPTSTAGNDLLAPTPPRSRHETTLKREDSAAAHAPPRPTSRIAAKEPADGTAVTPRHASAEHAATERDRRTSHAEPSAVSPGEVAAPERDAATAQDASAPATAKVRAPGSLPTPPVIAPERPVRETPARNDLEAAGRPAAAEPALIDEPWEAPAFGVETELGGIFYLLNLFVYLGLYGDFTQPRGRGLALDPWRGVALVGRRLLGPGDRDDPVWTLLDRLAAPDAFRPPRAWRVPRAWLDPFDGGGPWRWSAARGTLRLEHPANFPAVAVPRTDQPARDQLARELHCLRVAPEVRRASLRAEPQLPLARWVARLAAYADARLRIALELPPQTVLRRRARVFVTSSHVDVVLSLAELPLEVRFAGLDRTPGWIPAAGRFVAFHFE